MALNSDRDGFLIADERVLISDLTQSIRGIQRSADAILVMLQARERTLTRSRIANPNSSRTRVPDSRTRGPGSPAPSGPQRRTRTAGQGGLGDPDTRERDGRDRYTRQPGADVAGEVRQLTRQQAQQNAERERAEESRRTREGGDQARDERGRFGAGGVGGSEDEKKSMFTRMKEFFKDRSGEAIGDVDKVDPVIESANEVMGMVGGAVSALKGTGELGKAVIGRGFGGQRDRTTPWYKKLLQQLKLMRRDDGEFHRAELRALNEQQGGGDSGSFIGGILKMLFGPVGAALVGAAALAWATMGDKISGAWGSFITGIRGTWDSAVKTFLGIWEPIAKFFSDKFGIVTNAVSKAAEATNTAIKNVTGVDVKETAKKAAEVVYKGHVVAAEAAKAGFTATKDWFLGKTSKVFESGKRGAGAVSTGKGDHGGVSYGTYQMSSKKGVADKFIAGSTYAEQFKGLKAGSKEFSDKWKEVAKADPTFEAAQHDYIKATHYDPQMAKLKKGGIDLSGRGAAVQDSVWSTSVQFGGDTGLIRKALKGRDVKKMSDKDIVSAVQDYKLANNDTLFSSSDAATRAGTLARGSAEKSRLIKLAEAPAAAAAPTPSGNATAAPARGAALPVTAAPARGASSPVTATPARGAVPLATATPVPGTAAPVTAAPARAWHPAKSVLPVAVSTATAPMAVGAAPEHVVLSGPARAPTVTIPAQVPPPAAPRADAAVSLSSRVPMEVTVRNSERMAAQDVKDRRLAHIATGGLSA